MASSTDNAPTDWRTGLQQAKTLHVACVQKGDFTQLSQASPPASGPAPSQAMWQPQATTVVAEHQQIASNVQSTYKNLQSSGATKQATQQQLEASRQIALQASQKAINSIYNDAETKIESLPAVEQQAATEAFIAVMTTFMNFWQQASAAMANAVNEVDSWLETIWDDIDADWNDVTNSFESAANWAESL